MHDHNEEFQRAMLRCKSDYQIALESRAKWKAIAIVGWLTVAGVMILEAMR